MWSHYRAVVLLGRVDIWFIYVNSISLNNSHLSDMRSRTPKSGRTNNGSLRSMALRKFKLHASVSVHPPEERHDLTLLCTIFLQQRISLLLMDTLAINLSPSHGNFKANCLSVIILPRGRYVITRNFHHAPS